MSQFSMQALSPVKLVDSMTTQHPLGTSMVDDSVLNWAANRIQTLFTQCDMSFERARLAGIRSSVSDFFKTFLVQTSDALAATPGSTSIQGLLPLWIIAQLIKPTTLVESGVFVGSSLRMFRHALPEARILAYDISFGPLKYRDDSIDYRETEWMQHPPKIAGDENALAFFDDHINAVRRLEEARSLNFRWVLFDDNPNVGKLGQYRYPSLPSIPMIMDPDFPDRGVMEWRHPNSDKPLRYVHDADACAALRPHVRSVANIGAMMGELGLISGDKWLVELR